MPLKKVTVRRGTLGLTILFFAALASVLTLLLALHFRPLPQFRPIAITQSFHLINGSASVPTEVPAGGPLQFSELVWCNTAGHELNAVVSATFQSIDTVPGTMVSFLAGVPSKVPNGCQDRPTNPFTPPPELKPGEWRLILTATVTDAGKAQIVSVLSDPFLVVGVR